MTEKSTYIYVDIARNSGWRSEAEGSLNSSGQFAGSIPIPQIFPTHDTATNTGLSTSATETSGALGNREGFIRLCGGAKAGSTSVADWLEEIKKVWARGSSSTLDLARVVSAAKNRLQQYYGQWSQLWRSEQKMPLSKSTADRLATVGDRMGWIDSATSLNLPRGWNILFCLARLDRGTLEQQIQEGFIHPKLTLREAKELVARLRGKPTEARTRKANVRRWLRRSAEFVRDTLSDWEIEERELATEQLTRLIEQIRTPGGMAPMRNGNSLNFITQCNLSTDQRNNL